MTRRPWYARLLRALHRWSARVLAEESEPQWSPLPSYAEVKRRVHHHRTPRSEQ